MPGAAPFRLYALSNAGSLLALLGFPFYFETHFTRATQAWLWGCGFGAYALGCVLCAGLRWRAVPAANPPAVCRVDDAAAGPVDLWQRSLWLLLPCCASVLLLATTNKICQEVAVVPLLWVLPLALYLLSFIICFDNPRWYRRLPFGAALVAALGSLCWVLFQGTRASISLQLGIYCAGLFVCCMVCHGELYRLKPDPRLLTGFYLALAAGGALGSLFVAVVAPMIFHAYSELPWALWLCGLLFLLVCVRQRDVRWRPLVCAGLAIGLLAFGFALWRQAHRLDDSIVQRTRNFFGVLTVMKYRTSESNWPCLALVHGRTIHGLQFTEPERALWPTLYYGERSGIGLALRALPNGPRRLALVGLGVGTLTAYARPGDDVRVYEIDPEVQSVATSRFTYLAHCLGKVEIILGDARLSLEREASQDFDLLALDAFSDDTIPVHLLTQEAFAIYQRQLKTNGIIAVHVSNENLNLEPVLANLARRFDYRMAVIEHQSPGQPWIADSTWVLLSRSGGILDAPALRVAARPPQTNSVSIPLWTDDFASLFPILHARRIADSDAEFAEQATAHAQRLFDQGDYRGAVASYRQALRRHPDSPLLLNNLGFLLATCPETSLRDSQEAIELSEEACQLTHYRILIYASTLAAIYSETGRFAQAVAMQEKVCALESETGQPASRLNRDLLELYRAGRPYHQFSLAPRQ